MNALAQVAANPTTAWLPVALMIVIGVGFAAVSIIASLVIGPARTGGVKERTYESGMVPVGDTRRRFNVRFYIVAMIFLVFDVEIVFFYPWAVNFPHAVRTNHPLAAVMLASMGVFVLILLVAYLYAWGKGVFKWD